MKTNVMLSSITALLIAGTATAAEYHPFVGATIGVQGIVYSTEYDDMARANDMNLPEDFFAFGLTGGVRMGSHDAIYNNGLSVSLDMTTNSEIENKFTDAKIADIRTMNLTAMYEGFIRVSGDKARRIDLVLGAGAGTMNYHISDAATNASDTTYSPTMAFKIGIDFELTHNLTLSADTRFFLPTRSHYAPDTTFIVGGAVKYMF